jgi:hypothetical protein
MKEITDKFVLKNYDGGSQEDETKRTFLKKEIKERLKNSNFKEIIFNSKKR